MKTSHKFLSAALALCLALTLNVPICAAANESEGGATEPETTEKLIDVEVPATGRIIANPYKMKTIVDAETGETSRAQIVHQVQKLVNHSASEVEVNVSLTGFLASGSKAAFVTTPPELSGADKEIFLYVEFQTEPDQWASSYTGAANQLVVTEEGISVDNVMTLAPNGEGYLHFSGAMTTGSFEMWSGEDAFSVDLVFTFTDPNAALEEDEEEPDEAAPSETAEPTDDADQADDADEAAPAETTQPEDVTEPESAEPTDEDGEAAPAETTEPTDEDGEAAPAETAEPADEDGDDAEKEQATVPETAEETAAETPAQSEETAESEPTGEAEEPAPEEPQQDPAPEESRNL